MQTSRLAVVGAVACLVAAGAAALAAPPVAEQEPEAAPGGLVANLVLPWAQAKLHIQRVEDRKGWVPAPNAQDEPPPPTAPKNRYIRIETPDTSVHIDPWRGAVRVDAPYAAVDVNPDRGRARVQAPGVNLDVRW